MKVYEMLPSLSPREGFLRTAAAWKDAALIEFGPEGTMHYAQNSIHGEVSNIFTTGMEERQIIFGETLNLEGAVREVDRLYSPKLIFVTSSPVSEIIGTDLKLICAKLQSEVNARTICWNNVPMEGTESMGRKAAFTLAADYIGKNTELLKSTGGSKKFLVLGLDSSDWNGVADLGEIKRIMHEFAGLDCLNDRNGHYRLSDLALADWVLAVDPNSVPLAKAAEARFGTPWYHTIPYGKTACGEMLSAAEAALGIEHSGGWEKELSEIQRVCDLFKEAIRPRHRKIWLDMEESRAAALYRFFETETGLKLNFPQTKGSAFSFSGVVECLPEVGPEDIFIGCGSACSLYPESRTLCMSYPTSGQYMLSPYIPYMGTRGEANILNTMYSYIVEKI